jgi:uncharacterized membrane protein (DUF4010 family)
MHPVGDPGSIEGLLVAVLIGFLIGIDRERAEVRKGQPLLAGVRTFPLIALVGAVSVFLSDAGGSLLVVATFLAIATISAISYARASRAGSIGATTEIAALVTFLLGALAGAGEILVAGGCGVLVAILLVAKPRLEAFSRALSEEELLAALELAVISGIVLPLLPDRGFGPWGVLNPFDIWLVVVLVSAFSFAGFAAMRVFGAKRGVQLAAVLGALVSSTAVTLSLARRARQDPELARTAAGVTALASSVMCVRIAVFAGAVGSGLLPRLLPVLVAIAGVGSLLGTLQLRTASEPAANPAQSPIRNPFDLRGALIFAGLYALVLLVVRSAQEFLGSPGSYLSAVLSALVDVDAITIAFARAGPGASGWREPAAAVTLAVIVNTLVKLGIVICLGQGRFRTRAALSLSLMAAAGAVAGVLVYLGF